jgi:hypothetical protein
MKTRPDFKQAGYSPVQLDPADSRFSNARKNLQQGGFAGAVASDDADNLASCYFKVKIFEGPNCGGVIGILPE